MTPIHILPVDDLLEHEDCDDCACLPVTQPVEADGGEVTFLVVHNAWDGRE